jgi:hypothetical protein
MKKSEKNRLNCFEKVWHSIRILHRSSTVLCVLFWVMRRGSRENDCLYFFEPTKDFRLFVRFLAINLSLTVSPDKHHFFRRDETAPLRA